LGRRVVANMVARRNWKCWSTEDEFELELLTVAMASGERKEMEGAL
jgi:hypothetical protein